MSVTRSIRIEKELDEALQKLAKNEKMTVNSIVGRQVRRYVDWDRYTEKFHMVEISPDLLQEMMSRYTLDEARQLGRKMSKDVIRVSIQAIFVNVTVENALEFLRRFSLYTRRFEFEDSVEGRKHVLLLRHSMGDNWSAYLGGLIEELFEVGLKVKTRQTVVPEACTVEFEL